MTNEPAESERLDNGAQLDELLDEFASDVLIQHESHGIFSDDSRARIVELFKRSIP